MVDIRRHLWKVIKIYWMTKRKVKESINRRKKKREGSGNKRVAGVGLKRGRNKAEKKEEVAGKWKGKKEEIVNRKKVRNARDRKGGGREKKCKLTKNMAFIKAAW